MGSKDKGAKREARKPKANKKGKASPPPVVITRPPAQAEPRDASG